MKDSNPQPELEIKLKNKRNSNFEIQHRKLLQH